MVNKYNEKSMVSKGWRAMADFSGSSKELKRSIYRCVFVDVYSYRIGSFDD